MTCQRIVLGRRKETHIVIVLNNIYSRNVGASISILYVSVPVTATVFTRSPVPLAPALTTAVE